MAEPRTSRSRVERVRDMPVAFASSIQEGRSSWVGRASGVAGRVAPARRGCLKDPGMRNRIPDFEIP
ncbi:hypothetical protein GCM10023320_48410 [Pseudonocardia adelaidensis]|uniref:Uncharacterized protein n=1 Tax=Pseudonocardia adelaidensis TaxID=648754 RepID=A0ABP9NQ32_9PSEU